MAGPTYTVTADQLIRGDFAERYGLVQSVVRAKENHNLFLITFDTRESGNSALAPVTTVLRERHDTFTVRLED